jgi:hypothetical protein
MADASLNTKNQNAMIVRLAKISIIVILLTIMPGSQRLFNLSAPGISPLSL